MSEVDWVYALGTLDWTLIIITILGGSGVLSVWIQSRGVRKRKAYTREEEDRATVHEEVYHHNVEALRLANKAMTQVTKLSERLEEVESELGLLRKSYDKLYQWAERVVTKWPSIRTQEEAPQIPEGVHRP